MATRKSTTKRGGAKRATAGGTTRAAKRPAKRAADGGDVETPTPPPAPPRRTVVGEPPASARAIQRSARQSPYKMRLVIDEIRGKDVNTALSYLAFSKKHAARQIEKVLRSAVANAEFAAREHSAPLDVDELYVQHAVVNEGPKLKRFTPAAMGRATPIQKRTSHVEIVIAARDARRGNR